MLPSLYLLLLLLLLLQVGLVFAPALLLAVLVAGGLLRVSCVDSYWDRGGESIGMGDDGGGDCQDQRR